MEIKKTYESRFNTIIINGPDSISTLWAMCHERVFFNTLHLPFRLSGSLR